MGDRVKIYTITIDQAYRMDEQGTVFALTPWHGDTTYYKGRDDGGEYYILPEGCEISTNKEGVPMLFKDNEYVPLINEHGKPAIILPKHQNSTFLKKAGDEDNG